MSKSALSNSLLICCHFRFLTEIMRLWEGRLLSHNSPLFDNVSVDPPQNIYFETLRFLKSAINFKMLYTQQFSRLWHLPWFYNKLHFYLWLIKYEKSVWFSGNLEDWDTLMLNFKHSQIRIIDIDMSLQVRNLILEPVIKSNGTGRHSFPNLVSILPLFCWKWAVNLQALSKLWHYALVLHCHSNYELLLLAFICGTFNIGVASRSAELPYPGGLPFSQVSMPLSNIFSSKT